MFYGRQFLRLRRRRRFGCAPYFRELKNRVDAVCDGFRLLAFIAALNITFLAHESMDWRDYSVFLNIHSMLHHTHTRQCVHPPDDWISEGRTCLSYR